MDVRYRDYVGPPSSKSTTKKLSAMDECIENSKKLLESSKEHLNSAKEALAQAYESQGRYTAAKMMRQTKE